jgi:hypothetical protein
MYESPVLEKLPHGSERQSSASTGTETVHGVQRALQFENEETPGREASDCREETPESGSEPRAPSAPETSPEATPETSEPFVLAREKVLSDGSTAHVRHFAVALDGMTRPRDAEEQERASEAATAWHHDFLGLLSQWPSGVVFRFRYQVAPAQDETPKREKNPQRDEYARRDKNSQREDASRLGVSLIVTVEARSAKTAEARVKQIALELMTDD